MGEMDGRAEDESVDGADAPGDASTFTWQDSGQSTKGKADSDSADSATDGRGAAIDYRYRSTMHNARR